MIKKIIALILTASGLAGLIPTATTAEADILCVGDLMALGAQINKARDGSEYDFEYVFENVEEYISGADLAIGNLETQVAGKSYGYTQVGVPGTPVLNAPEEYLEAVKHAGFDVLVTANNHSMDKGTQGLINTVNKIKDYGFATTGMFAEKDSDDRLLIQEVNDIKIGILSYTDLLNTGLDAEGLSERLNRYSESLVSEEIAAIKEKGAEFVIVYIHWGKENVNEQNAKQEKMAQFIANAGADMIIGSHPHALQPIETITTEDGREVIVTYSLGNFVSSMPREMNKESVMITFTLKRDKWGKVTVEAFKHLPVYTGSGFQLQGPAQVSSAHKKNIENVLWGT